MSAPLPADAGPSPGQVLKRLGLVPRDEQVTTQHIRPYRASKGDRCPICGQAGECIIIRDEQRQEKHIWCVRGARMDDSGLPCPFGFQAEITRYYLRHLDTDEAIPTKKQYQSYPLASEVTRRHIFETLARLFPLEAHHRRMLKKRGYPVKECGPTARYRFSTLPSEAKWRYGVVNMLWSLGAARNDTDVLGTFGFGKDRRHGASAPIGFLVRESECPDQSALIEWISDEGGRLVGFQFAPDRPEPKKKRLTPARQLNTETPHVVYPAQELTQEVWYTEGVHKANLTADRRGVIALASLGASSWRAMLRPAEKIVQATSRKAWQHVIALDSDQWGKSYETGLARELTKRGYNVALARWPENFKGPDDALVAGQPIDLVPFTDGRSAPKTYQSILHTYPWQRVQETPEERTAKLRTAARRVRDRVAAHAWADIRDYNLVIASPPGIGKTYSVSELGTADGGHDIAWIAERHDMAASVPALKGYHHIYTPDAATCPYWEMHHILAGKGYNTAIFHKEHPGGPCPYILQFEQPGSTLFQVEYAPTTYPPDHGVIVIDEFSPARWMPERAITLTQLQAAMRRYVTGSYPDLLSRALQAVLTDASQEREKAKEEKRSAVLPWGKSLFDALDQYAHGHLQNWVAALSRMADANNKRPKADIDFTASDATEQAGALPEVLLPHIWAALAQETQAWRRGGDWNSLLRIGPAAGSGEMALHITEPLHLSDTKPLPPAALLDATADAELLARMYGKPVHLEVESIDPPPHMRHIAVRTGKRYGKESNKRDHTLARTIAECRFFLERVNPTGEKAVGLITYEHCEGDLADALGLTFGEQTGHFWAMKGSNRLEQVDILLIIGTPTPHPSAVERLARAFYHKDLTPINPACTKAEDGTLQYADPRMQRVANAMIEAELAQCAARNRTIQQDGKTVITFCASKEIAFLPATETVTSLPQLAKSGETRKAANQQEAEQKLAAAAKTLAEQGLPVNKRTLQVAAKVRGATVCEWLRTYKPEPIQVLVPETLIYKSISKTGTKTEIHPLGVSSEEAAHLPRGCLFAHHQPFWREHAGRLVCSACNSA
jgi:hypothetical protein